MSCELKKGEEYGKTMVWSRGIFIGDPDRRAYAMQVEQNEMDEAIEQWLEAHQGYQDFLAATETLYNVFVRTWQGSRRNLAEAFTDFREALLKAHEC